MGTDEQLERRIRASAPTADPLDGPGVLLMVAARQRRRRRTRLGLGSALFGSVALALAIFLSVGQPTTSTVSVGEDRPSSSTTTPGATPVSPGATAAQLAAGHWSVLPPAPIPPRSGASVVWTGHEMLVWGGYSGLEPGVLHDDGAAYAPASRTWRRLPPAPISPREGQAAVWTGTEMVVWGGFTAAHDGGRTAATSTGAAYDPSTNQWRVLSAAPLTPRGDALSAWTGREVLVLGGQAAQRRDGLRPASDGALWDPASDTWTGLTAPVAPRDHGIDWIAGAQVGESYVAWSDWSIVRNLGHGTESLAGGDDVYTYEEAAGRWRLEPKASHAIPGVGEVVSVDADVLVSGLPINCGVCSPPFMRNVSALYHPDADTWSPIPSPFLGSPDGIVWTGSSVLATSTDNYGTDLLVAAAYDHSSRRWLKVGPAPLPCANQSSPVWTGRQVLLYCPRSGREPGADHDGLALTPAG